MEVSGASPVRPVWRTGVTMESAVHLGVDIGKSSHYALAVDAAGKPIYQTSVTNDEMALRKLVDWAKERQAIMVVDQPGGAAALLLKLCWQWNVRIGYLHGRRTRSDAAAASSGSPGAPRGDATCTFSSGNGRPPSSTCRGGRIEVNGRSG